jgi:hypothetical protein
MTGSAIHPPPAPPIKGGELNILVPLTTKSLRCLVPKLQLGNVNATGSSASTTQSWSFSSDCVPKLELGNENFKSK